MALLLRGASYVVCNPCQVEQHCDVLIEGERIAAIGPSLEAPPQAVIIDAQGCAIVPGLINAHTHLYQNFLKGASPGLPLEPWCDEVLFPTVGAVHAEFVAGNSRPAYLWSTMAAIEMIRGGVTTCLDMDMLNEQALYAWEDSGLRGVVGVTLSNMWVPDELRADEQLQRAEALRFVDQWHEPGGLLQVFLAPSAPFLCDDGLLGWARDQAEQRNLGLQIHVAETALEVANGERDWGMHPVERLHKLDLLTPRLSAVHCVHLDTKQIDLLAAGGVSVVHCPKSNMKLADGVAPIPDLLKAGIPVCLGTDGAASNDLLDMWEEMRAAILLARVTTGRADALSEADVLAMATVEAANVCRIDAGEIAPGKLADLAIVDLQQAHALPVHKILGTLVFCTKAADVRDTIIGGRVVMLNRMIMTVDEGSLMREADEVGTRLFSRRREFPYGEGTLHPGTSAAK